IFLFTAPLMGRRFVRVRERQTAIDWATEIQELLEVQYPEAARLRLVCDQLNTQGIGSLYEAFPPEQARRLATRVWRSTILPSMAVGSISPRASSVPSPCNAWIAGSQIWRRSQRKPNSGNRGA